MTQAKKSPAMSNASLFPVSDSHTVITELMIPSYANFGGKVHGGIILSLMDKVAYACATKHARMYCVTASVDAVHFLSPVEVGEMVSLYASVNYVGNSSMEIGIRTEARNIRSGVAKHTNTSYFTMVGLGDEGKPASVPGLILESAQDVRRFIEGRARRQIARSASQPAAKMQNLAEVQAQLESLKPHNCRVAWDPLAE